MSKGKNKGVDPGKHHRVKGIKGGHPSEYKQRQAQAEAELHHRYHNRHEAGLDAKNTFKEGEGAGAQ